MITKMVNRKRQLLTNAGKCFLVVVMMILPVLFFVSGCVHEPLNPSTTDIGNGEGTDGGTGGNGIPCDPNTIYFQQQILPILNSSCTRGPGHPVGCHETATMQDGVNMTSYFNVIATGDIEFDEPFDSDFWEVITSNDPDDRMPPPGENQLTPAQLNLITQWLNQGAQNLVCDDGLGPCDSTGISFATDIQPIIQNKCLGCHGTATSANFFISLSNYAGVSAAANTGQLLGAVTHNPNYQPMPKGGAMIAACEIAKIRNWIAEGSLNN